jgi:signal transduction histidine kinase
MSGDGPRGGDWHWLWEAYVVGICVAAMIAVVLLDEHYPGHPQFAIAALAGIVAGVLALGRFVTRLPEQDWRAYVFVGVVVALWTVALAASPVAVAAVPAIYPLAFSTLSLRVALVVTTAINLIPLTLVLLTQGVRSPNLSVAIAFTLVGLVATPVIGTAIMTSMRQRRQLATLVAELAASRAEGARLAREAGTAAERERLAREIHDTLAQGFTSIVTLAQAIEPELDSDPVAAKRHLELIRATARENLDEARAMVAELTPSALNDGSLPSAIERQCDRLAAEAGIAVTLRADSELPALGMAADVVLLRAAQEAFANVRRHARASRLTVDLLSSNGAVRLAVADNGIGLADTHTEGFGLRGMRSRVGQVGGTVSVDGTPGGGTTVTVEVPA